MTRQYMVGPSTTISAGTFRSLVSPLQSSAAFLVVPLVLLAAASDGLAEGFSPISAMGVFLAALMVSGGNEELGWRAVLEPVVGSQRGINGRKYDPLSIVFQLRNILPY